MVSEDLKLFHTKLYKPKNIYDMSGYMLQADCKIVGIPEVYKKVHNYAYEEFKDTEDTCIDSIIRTVLNNFEETKEIDGPPKVINYAFIFSRNASDFTMFPSFYSQTILPVLKYYTEERDGFVKTDVTYNDIINKITKNKLELLSDIRLNSGTNKLQEVFINNAGVCIFDTRVIPRDILRDTLATYYFDDGKLNFKVDRRMLQGKRSILDWRSNDS